jgi:hypothetical protein
MQIPHACSENYETSWLMNPLSTGKKSKPAPVRSMPAIVKDFCTVMLDTRSGRGV